MDGQGPRRFFALVVEQDPALIRRVADRLRALGVGVLSTGSPTEAMDAVAALDADITAVFVDPGLRSRPDTRAVVRQILSRNPAAAVMDTPVRLQRSLEPCMTGEDRGGSALN